MATPEKYSHIDFKPPSGVRREAEYGLKLRREHGRGGTAVGIARARDLSNGKEVSPSTVRRMKAFFDRHASDEKADGFNRGDASYPSNGKIANLLWGGPSGYSWAKKVVEQMNAADEKDSRSLRPFGSTHGIKPKVVVVHGAPASGKSTYVMMHKGENDVVFDFDHVMSAISGNQMYKKNDALVSYCTDIRSLIMKRALQKSGVDKTWIVTTNVSDDLSKQLSDVPVEYVHVQSTKEDCLSRVDSDPYMQQNAEELRKVIEDYFAEDSKTEQRFAPATPGVERRFIGNFSESERPDPELLRVERRADPATGKPRTYIVGYAATFHRDSLLLGDFVERIDPAAFEIVEERKDSEGQPLQTRCLFNHDPNHLLGRFPTTMTLTVDDKGLKYTVLLPESRSDIAESVERGDLRGSSFSFVVADGGERWSTENGRSIRLVTKIKSLLDCGPVTYPAYGDGSISVAKRSYENFVAAKAEKRDAKPKRLEARAKLQKAKSDAAAVAKELQAFVGERRGFCATGAGGGIDNSCGKEGGGGSPSKGQSKDEMLDKARKVADDYNRPGNSGAKGEILKGAVMGALVGAASGNLVGVAAGAITGAAMKGLIEAGKWVLGTNEKKFEKLKGEMGVSGDHLKSLAESAYGSNASPKNVAHEGNAIAIWSKNAEDGITLITKDSQFDKSSKGTSIHYQPGAEMKPGSLDMSKIEKSASAMNASSVSVEAWSGKDVKALEAKGYKRVADSPGGYSTSKGVYEKQLGKSKRSFDELQEFLAERRAFCATGPGGGIDNTCGRNSVIVENSQKSLEQQRLEAAGEFEPKGPRTKQEKIDDMKDYVRLSGHGWADFVRKSQAHDPDNVRNAQHAKNKAAKIFDEEGPAAFDRYMEEIGMNDRPSSPPIAKHTGEYEEYDPSLGTTKQKEADLQGFLDRAREGQLSRGGKDQGKSDDGSGVQTWSKGDDYPWTVKQVGDTDGYVQGMHPDGTKTEKYPFSGTDTSDADKKLRDEIRRRKDKRSAEVLAEMTAFLKARR